MKQGLFNKSQEVAELMAGLGEAFNAELMIGAEVERLMVEINAAKQRLNSRLQDEHLAVEARVEAQQKLRRAEAELAALRLEENDEGTR